MMFFERNGGAIYEIEDFEFFHTHNLFHTFIHLYNHNSYIHIKIMLICKISYKEERIKI